MVTPLIALQRRLAEAGRIRMGEKTEAGHPKRLTVWRITSPTKALIDEAAGLYGGTPKPWDSPTGGQWQLTTTVSELPVLVMPSYSFRQQYEHRTSPTKVERRCDGIELDVGAACLCNSDEPPAEVCELVSRLTVALPELTTMLGWRLETKGENAAHELLASMDLVHGVGGGRPFVPAKLRIVERRGNVDGQAVRYVVPVIDVALRYDTILSVDGQASLPAGYKPIEKPASEGTTLAEGLEQAETQTLKKPPRVELPDDDVDDQTGGALSPDATPDASSPAPPVTPTPREQKPLTKAQSKQLDVLVGTLRDTLGKISTEQLWAGVAKERNYPVEQMVELLDGRDVEGGVLHWGPLRDSLKRGEASQLIDRLSAYEATLPKAAS